MYAVDLSGHVLSEVFVGLELAAIVQVVVLVVLNLRLPGFLVLLFVG